MTSRLVLALLLAMLAACSSTPDRDEPLAPVEEIYRDAYASRESGNLLRAEMLLRQIMSRYPFTEYAVQAHLDFLYVMAEMGNIESLTEEADRFVRENPRHPNLDYVYYMKGLGYYRKILNPLEELVDLDLAQRDIADSETAFRNFTQLVSRFPASPYSADARERMIELRNRIARHEIVIAEYYLRRGAWISAIQRANKVLRDLQGTPAEIDALMVLVRGYEELGLAELAETPRRILAENAHRTPVVLNVE